MSLEHLDGHAALHAHAGACGVAAGRMLLDALTGASPDPDHALVRLLADDATLQALDEEDTDASAALVGRFRHAAAHADTLAGRVQRALAADRATIALPDGSVLDRARAERLLAHKEQARVYPPLRDALANAMRPHERFADDRTQFRRASGGELVRPWLRDQRLRRRARLTAFLTATLELRKEAIGALESLGRTPIDGPASLQRALDLPAPRDDGAFSDELTTTIGRLLRERLPADSTPLKRVAAPRHLAGHVIIGPDAVRLLVAPGLRVRRHLALARGLGRSLAHAIHAQANPSDDDRNGNAPSLRSFVGDALGVAAIDVAARRHAGFPISTAVDAARVARITMFLETRIACAVALCASEETEEVREGLHAALGTDVGIDVCHRLREPPWPDGLPPASSTEDALDRAEARIASASIWSTWRASFDEDFAFRGAWPSLWEQARDRLATWSRDDREATQGVPPPSCGEAADAWRTVVTELL